MRSNITNPKTEYYLHYRGSAYCTKQEFGTFYMRLFKGVSIAPLTTSTYALWSVEMEALLEAKGLWKFTQVLVQDFMTTLEPLTLK